MMRYLISSLLILFVVIACNPVKKVMGDPEKKKKVTDQLLKEGICRPDTFLLVITDTLVQTDTLGVIVQQTDTIVVNDTIRITKTKWRDILKTVTIRDTLLKTIVDESQVQALRDENNTLKGRLAQRKDNNYDSMLWIALAGAVMGGTGVYLLKRW